MSTCGDALARQIMLFGAPQDDAALSAAIDEVDEKAVRDMAAQLTTNSSPSLACVGPPRALMDNADLATRLSV